MEGEQIRVKELLAEIRTLPFEKRAKTNDADVTVRLDTRRDILNSMINRRLFVMEAEARGIKVSDEEIEAAFHDEEEKEQSVETLMEGMKGTGAGHEHAHGSEGHTRDELKKMHDDLIMEKLLGDQITDDAVRKYYDEHGDEEFSVPIPLVSYEIVSADPTDSAVIDRLYDEVGGKATTLADALTSMKGVPPTVTYGVTPLVPVSQVVAEMRERTENLHVGEVAKPFHIDMNGQTEYALVRLITHADRPALEIVDKQIRWKLLKSFVDELWQKYNVVLNEELLDYKVGG
jgi:hypothetical protein